MQLDANSTWFNFSAHGSKGDGGDFSVYAFEGSERVSAPYEFEIELVSTSAKVDLTDMLGREASLSIADRSGASRVIHGVIRHMEQLHTANMFTHYRCKIVPRFWFLGENSQHRIFQNLSILDITKQILTEQGFTAESYSFKMQQDYQPREYCVQYGESDLHFIIRLCEEEGVYYYFEHSENAHTLCFSDAAGGPNINGESDLRYFAGSGQVSDTAVIHSLNLHEKINSDAAAYREWNFTTPRQSLAVAKNEGDQQKAPTPGGLNLENYKYPHLYQVKKEGERYANIQLLRQLTYAKWIEGATDVSRLLPGFAFTTNSHKNKNANAQWWTVSVQHKGEQPQVLQHEAPSERGMFYEAHFSAIPFFTRFVPELEHPKSLIIGDQTAIVTGPGVSESSQDQKQGGEEIYVDNYGRVKVQFFWDREGNWDDKTTCWIRVSQGWAGSAYGSIAIPRIGHEVIVSFLEGNPDRPIVTGRVYHELNMQPYELPAHKTRTVVKSMSTPAKAGKEGEPRGFNELRIEDKLG